MKKTRRREIGFRNCQDRGSRIADTEPKSEMPNKIGSVIGDPT